MEPPWRDFSTRFEFGQPKSVSWRSVWEKVFGFDSCGEAMGKYGKLVEQMVEAMGHDR